MSDKDKLKQVEDFAYRYMTKDEIVLITGVSSDEISNTESEIHKSFQRGRLLRKAELNYAIIQLSNQLSSPAMQMEIELATNTHLTDLRQ